MKIKNRNIYQIVVDLVGPIQPVGETHEDRQRLENSEELIYLVDMLLGDINRAATNKDRVEYSMKAIGERCDDFLKDVSVAY